MASSLPNLFAASTSPGTSGGSTNTTPVSLTNRWPTIIQLSAGSGVDHLKAPSLIGMNIESLPPFRQTATTCYNLSTEPIPGESQESSIGRLIVATKDEMGI